MTRAPEIQDTKASPELLGGVCGALLLALMKFPTDAWPREFLVLALGLAVVAALLLARVVAGRSCRAMPGAAWLVLPAAALLAVWALCRWGATQFNYAGLDCVLGLFWLPMAMLGGLALSWSGGAAAWTGLRRAMALAAAAYGAYALYQYFVLYPAGYAALVAEKGAVGRDLATQSLLHALKERRVGGGLGAPNLFAAQLAVMAVFALGSLRDAKKIWRAAGATGLALALVAILITRSRGGLLTFGGAMALGGLYWMLSREKSPRPGAAAKAAAALSFLSIAARSQAMQESLWQRVTNISTIQERFNYWGIAINVWAYNLAGGGGPGAFELNYPSLKPPGARESQYAHSWFFQSLADLGAVGAAVETAFWIALLWMLWRALRGAKSDAGDRAAGEKAWLLVALAALCFNGLIEYAHAWPAFRMWIGFLAGGACGLASMERTSLEGTGQAENARKQSSQGWAYAASLCLLAAFALPKTWTHQWAVRDFNDARDYMEAGEAARAIESVQSALAREPNEPRYLALRAGLKTAQGDLRGALGDLQIAMRMNSYSASLWAQTADIHERMGDDAEALKSLGEAVERYPTNVEYRLRRARLNLKLKDLAAARADLEGIEKGGLPLWEYQEPVYAALRRQAGLAEARTSGSAGVLPAH